MSNVSDLTQNIVLDREVFLFCVKYGLILKVSNSMCFVLDLSRLLVIKHFKAFSSIFFHSHTVFIVIWMCFEFLFLLDLLLGTQTTVECPSVGHSKAFLVFH